MLCTYVVVRYNIHYSSCGGYKHNKTHSPTDTNTHTHTHTHTHTNSTHSHYTPTTLLFTYTIPSVQILHIPPHRSTSLHTAPHRSTSLHSALHSTVLTRIEIVHNHHHNTRRLVTFGRICGKRVCCVCWCVCPSCVSECVCVCDCERVGTVGVCVCE